MARIDDTRELWTLRNIAERLSDLLTALHNARTRVRACEVAILEAQRFYRDTLDTYERAVAELQRTANELREPPLVATLPLPDGTRGIRLDEAPQDIVVESDEPP